MAKMAVNEETVTKAMKICDKSSDGIANVLLEMKNTFNAVSNDWKDEKFSAVKKSVEENLETLKAADLQIIEIGNTLKKIREYIKEYDTIIM